LAFASYLVNDVSIDGVYISNEKPNYIIGFSPVIRNDKDGYGYERIGENHKKFSPYSIYTTTEDSIPPSLIFSGIKDPLIDIEDLKAFVKTAKSKRNQVRLIKIKNVAHSMRKTYP